MFSQPRPIRRRKVTRGRRGTSLIEILIVVSLVLFLLAMLVPGLGATRERARRMMCANNLRQWGMALQYYRDDWLDYLPQEGVGTTKGLTNPSAWFNALPPYLDLPSYNELEGAGVDIHEIRDLHVWICPSKDLTGAFKSTSGKNQFHYGMNQVLDGLGKRPRGSKDAPGFFDLGEAPLQARRFLRKPNTVFMLDIAPNAPAGTPRNVATKYQRDFSGRRMARFHGDYANVLYLTGAVGHCTTDDLVTDHDFRRGRVVWDTPTLYWGYRQP